MSDVIASRSLASQALTNLVNQFARPLDFLRELVQNSLDAGTPRVEVAIDYEPGDGGDGVVSIHVDDFGEGMDERIIDEQLTRLFSSSKEDDLTKIGKFGIGFTSIFAVRPDAVLVHTGRHGEFWELLFHADRSFEKVRVDKPVTGTKITLYKRMPGAEVARFIREARYVLGYWCEHSTTPITFTDRTRGAPAAAEPDSEDPFAAFAAPADPAEVVNRPFALEGADLQRAWRDGRIEIVVGVTDAPRYGYYNGGLTLVNSVNDDVIGTFAERLGHLAFKVRADTLEHTLTRDNVLQDAAWQAVMSRVVGVADKLREDLVIRTEHATLDGEDPARWHALLLREVRAATGRDRAFLAALRTRRLFRGHRDPISLEEIERQERWLGRLLTHPGDGPLAEALHEDEVVLVRAGPETRELLAALAPPSILGIFATERHLVDAGTRFLLPRVAAVSELPTDERLLIEGADALVVKATRGRARLAAGDLGGARQDLAVEGARDGRLFERKRDGWLRLPLFLRRRTLLVNRAHPHVRALVAAGLAEPDLARFALAQSLLVYEGLESEACLRRLFELARGEAA